ncbi:MAG TPA: hypothetical protein VMU94_19700 [Streptosporangiaceae bacterium]|nr:hypothetical protein [Streptosporangiaceae bacterium]
MHGLSRFGPSRRHFLAAAGAAGLASTPATRTREIASDRTISGTPPSALAQISSQQSRSLTPWFAGLSDRLSASCNVVCLSGVAPVTF